MSEYWESTLQTLFAFMVLSVVIERALYQIFNMAMWQKIEDFIDSLSSNVLDLKPWVSIGICSSIVFKLKLDMIATLFDKTPDTPTMMLTGLFLSGGSTTVYEFLKTMKQIREIKVENTRNTIKEV